MVLGVIEGGDAPLVYGWEIYEEDAIYEACVERRSSRRFAGECVGCGCLECLVEVVGVLCLAMCTIGVVFCVSC